MPNPSRARTWKPASFLNSRKCPSWWKVSRVSGAVPASRRTWRRFQWEKRSASRFSKGTSLFGHPHLLTQSSGHYPVSGSAFHFGTMSRPAIKTEAARKEKTPSHPQLSLKNPGIVPPTIAPTEPRPLMVPEAVEAPFRVPKSTAAVALTSESGPIIKNPARNKSPAVTSLLSTAAKSLKRNNKTARVSIEMTLYGIRRDWNNLSEA